MAEECDGTPMRQVPSNHIPWSTTVWVDEKGEKVRSRHYNIVSGKWKWGDADRQPIVDAGGRVGFRVYDRFRTVPQMIALAWVSRRKPMRRMQTLHGDSAAHLLMWTDEADDTDDSTDDDEEPHESWRPLELKMGLVPCFDTGWEISSRGRVRGGFAQPIIGYRDHIPVFNVGLVPIDMATSLIHGRYRPPPPPPRIRRTLRMLQNGKTLRNIASVLAVASGTAWGYVHQALRCMSTQTAERIIPTLCSAHTIAILETLAKEDPTLLTIRFRDMILLVKKIDGRRHHNSELYAVRDLLQRQYVRQ